MHIMTEQNKLIWDITRSHELAFLSYFPLLVDHAALLGASSSLDDNGVAFDLMPAADFFVLFGTQPQPRLPMGPAFGNAADLTNWKSSHDLLCDQTKCKATLRKFVLDTVPKELLIPMQDVNRSLRLRSTEYIITTLPEQLRTLTKADFEFLMFEL